MLHPQLYQFVDDKGAPFKVRACSGPRGRACLDLGGKARVRSQCVALFWLTTSPCTQMDFLGVADNWKAFANGLEAIKLRLAVKPPHNFPDPAMMKAPRLLQNPLFAGETDKYAVNSKHVRSVLPMALSQNRCRCHTECTECKS